MSPFSENASDSYYNEKFEAEEQKNRKVAFFFTLGFYAVILGLFLYFGFRTPLPLPEERGIQIVLGEDEFGADADGDESEEETESETDEQATESQRQNAEESVEDVDASMPDATESVAEDPTELTQDTEDAPSLEESEANEQESESQEETEDEPETEDEAKTKERSVDDRTLFQPSSGGKGDDQESGDKGAEDGDPQSESYEDQGKSPKEGEGISFNLRGRSLVGVPQVEDKTQKTGKVVVEIRVNADGNVIFARPGVKGSTTSDKELLDKAKQAALEAQFSPDEDAQIEQSGTMTFIFRLKE